MVLLVWYWFIINLLTNIHVSGVNSVQKQNGLSNSFVYRIATHRKLDQFINASNGQRLRSRVMKMNNFDFQLHFYPNGRFEHQANEFHLYLCVNNLSKKTTISSMFVDWTITIYELNLSWIVKNRQHSDNTKCRGFVLPDNAQILEPLNKLYQNEQTPLQSVTFGVTINIQRIFDAQQILNNEISIQINKHNTLIWNINNKHVLNEMLLSQHQQSFVSSEVYDNLWYISLAPNGFHEGKNESLDMYLHIVSLPKAIGKLKMQCNLKISELNINHQMIAEWTNLDRGWGWSSGSYSMDILKAYAASSSFDQLTLISECETLAIFDANGGEMKMRNQWKYFKLSAKNEKVATTKTKQDKYKYLPKMFDERKDDEYCLEKDNNMSNYIHFANINRILTDMSEDMDMVRQQLFVTIGIFTMNFGVTVFMFGVLASILCCGCL